MLDVRLPGVSGLDFQGQLARQGISFPIIFMTGHGDIPMSVRAMKAGAVDFLTKPFRDQDMLDAVTAAIERDRAAPRRGRDAGRSARPVRALTRARARGDGACRRRPDEQADRRRLGLSEITVKIHRGHVMRKMGVRSLADLVRMAEALGVSQTRRTTDQT